MFAKTGEYYEHAYNGITKSKYYTFTPKPLTDGDYYSMDEELSALLVEAHEKLGILKGMLPYISNYNSLAELFLLEESSYSRNLDYIDADFYTVLKNRDSDKNGKIYNIASAYKYSFENQITAESLRRYYNIALDGPRTNSHVGFRNEPFFFGDVVTSRQQYNPTYPEQIIVSINHLFQFLEQEHFDILIRAALSHYQLEIIHPFKMYNGIVGRILLVQVLNNSGLGVFQFISLSKVLYHRKKEYFKLLSSTQSNGNYQQWILFSIQCIVDATEESIEIIRSYEETALLDEMQIIEQKPSSPSILAVHGYFKRYLVAGMKQIVENLELSYATVSAAIQTLQDMGLIEQVSTSSRNRLYLYRKAATLFLGQDF